jgi:phage-related minor tail protein
MGKPEMEAPALENTMRDRISISNTTGMPMFIGSDMIAPGDTRDFFADQVPEHYRPAPAQAEPTAEERAAAEEQARLEAEERQRAEHEARLALSAKINDLLSKTVENIKASFPVLTVEELTAVAAAELLKGDAARKTLLESLSSEINSRANG